MDTESIFTSPLNTPFQEIEITKRCPKCQSVFITEKECESCQFQFRVEPVGEPYSFKSLTYIRNDFEQEFRSINYIKNNFSYNVSSAFPAVIEYKRKLNRRREVLCRYLFESIRGERETRKLFFIELLEICYELLDMKMNTFDLLFRIEGHDSHPYYEKLCRLLVNYEENKLVKKSGFLRSILEYSLFGLIRTRFILILGAFLTALILFSLYLYSEILLLIS